MLFTFVTLLKYLIFIICRALVRPGRFDTKINVPMPDVKARHDILKVHIKNVQMAEGMCCCSDLWITHHAIKCKYWHCKLTTQH